MAHDIKNVDGNVTHVDRAAQDVRKVSQELSIQSRDNIGGLLNKLNVFMAELKRVG